MKITSTGFLQVNGMYISETALNKLCQDIHEQYGISLAVCKIFGKRWSYIAGTGEILYAGVRVQINDFYGLIADELTDPIKKEVTERIRDFFKGESL